MEGSSGRRAGRPGGPPERRLSEAVEFHYKRALELRANFPLAALNLAGWQYAAAGQLAEAERNLIENCATRMEAEQARDYNQHVRTQIECLISGARLLLGDYAPAGAQSVGGSHRARRRWSEPAGVGAAQTETAAAAAREPSPECASKISHWMRMAREKVKQIGEAHGERPQRPISGNEPAALFGDLNKQLARINWIEARCAGPHETETETETETLGRVVGALEFAISSGTPVEARLYLDCADVAGSRDKRLAINMLERALSSERQKRPRAEAGLAPLLVGLARHYATIGRHAAALERLEEALASETAGAASAEVTANHLTLAAQLAYDSNEFERSERYYERALEVLRGAWPAGSLACASSPIGPEAGRQLASAHANYGAILEVRGRGEAARSHYRRALDCDPNNRVAAANLDRTAAGRGGAAR